VTGFLFAATYIKDALTSLELCEKAVNAHTTIGVHPCRASEPLKNTENQTFSQKKTIMTDYFQAIDDIIAKDQDQK